MHGWFFIHLILSSLWSPMHLLERLLRHAAPSTNWSAPHFCPPLADVDFVTVCPCLSGLLMTLLWRGWTKQTLSMTCRENNVYSMSTSLWIICLYTLWTLIRELQNNFKYVCLLCWFDISMPAFKAFWKVNDLQYITLCRSNEKGTITASYYNVIISLSVFTF